MPTGTDSGTHANEPETELQRWNRNFAELLQELRVAQTGVQILFAFLLTLPFSSRFSTVDEVDRVAYLVTLCVTAVATALLIAPVSYHRLVFRRGDKPQLVRIASVLAELGLACLLLAIGGAVFVVVDVVSGAPLAAALTAGVLVIYIALWYVMPLSQRSQDQSSHSDRG